MHARTTPTPPGQLPPPLQVEAGIRFWGHPMVDLSWERSARLVTLPTNTLSQHIRKNRPDYSSIGSSGQVLLAGGGQPTDPRWPNLVHQPCRGHREQPATTSTAQFGHVFSEIWHGRRTLPAPGTVDRFVSAANRLGDRSDLLARSTWLVRTTSSPPFSAGSIWIESYD